ncbi:MAG: FAD-dependent oxidoreductase, partial [Mucilaginibacter sp.]
SKLKTILVEQGTSLGGMTAVGMCIVNVNPNFQSGIWTEFRRHINNFYKTTPGYDTSRNDILRFEPHTGSAILKKITDTVKNLSVKLNAPVIAIKKDGTGWDVTVTINKETVTIKAKVVIDATETAGIATMASAKFDAGIDSSAETKLYRTGIAVADSPPFPAFSIPLKAIVVKDLENFLVTEKALSFIGTTNLAVQMTLGQGAGATAAFLAFFKTTTKNLNVRIIQGEILDHKGYIFPVTDISFSDPYFRSVQQVCATGLLKGVQKVDGDHPVVIFEPDSAVYTQDIQPVLTELYTRTFLWFNKVKPGAKFTVGNLLSFISEITLNDPENLQLTMQKTWKTTYKFKSDFDLNRPVTRYEFAALANKFLNPFARTVDLAGKVVN